jgi:hypothetical protein
MAAAQSQQGQGSVLKRAVAALPERPAPQAQPAPQAPLQLGYQPPTPAVQPPAPVINVSSAGQAAAQGNKAANLYAIDRDGRVSNEALANALRKYQPAPVAEQAAPQVIEVPVTPVLEPTRRDVIENALLLKEQREALAQARAKTGKGFKEVIDEKSDTQAAIDRAFSGSKNSGEYEDSLLKSIRMMEMQLSRRNLSEPVRRKIEKDLEAATFRLQRLNK